MTVKPAGSMSIKRYVKLSLERQNAHDRFENGEQNFSEVENLDRRFWDNGFKVTERFGKKAVEDAQIAAGVKESMCTWS